MKVSFLFLVSCFLFLVSCNNHKNIDFEKESKSIIGFEEYQKVNKMIADSLKLWYKNKLGYYRYNYGNSKFIEPDILCFNNNKNKFVSALLQKHIDTNTNSDGIDFFYGVKIKGIWYFIDGAFIVLPREMYQKDITKPLSFEKLHEIALKEVFSGYLKEKEKPFWVFWKPVEYEVNEAWFDYHFNPGSYYFNPTDTKREKLISESLRDSLLMLNVMDNWRDKSQRMHMNYAEMWEYYYKTKFPL